VGDGKAGGSAREASRRILVVDDDRLLAETLRAMIADFAQFDLRVDVSIEVTTSGRDAARRLEADERFDAVICDLGMPGVSGISLYATLVARHSPLVRRFVLVTGGVFSPADDAFLERHPLACLQKPFDAEQLATMLRPLLET
jgi:CheY-like chemotaxis protein